MDTSTALACWKCGHVRTPGAVAPDWQCPACGVAYNKADNPARQGATASRGRRGARTSPLALRLGWLRAFVARHRLASAAAAVAIVALGSAAWVFSPWSDRSKDLAVVDAGMASVRNALFDVESARWRDVRVVVKDAPNGRLRTLCGEVNAKNRFGGYIGFQRFMASAKFDAAFDDDSHTFAGLYAFFCRDERK